MDLVLASLKWQSAIAHFDNIVVFPKTVERHLNHLRHLLTVPREADLLLKLEKCPTFADIIKHLAQIIRPGKPEIADSSTDAVR